MTMSANPDVHAYSDGATPPSALTAAARNGPVSPRSLQVAPGAAAISRPVTRPRASASGVLLAAASLLLAALSVAMGAVSWHAQYAYIYAVKHERLASALEAFGLDCGAVVFSILGIALARLGRRAVIERALVCICAAGSCAMNAAGADLGSPRSVGAFVMPPVLFAITSDRLVSVIRRIGLGPAADAESQRSAWRTGGMALLYLLRLTAAPASTMRGARRALLDATPLPTASAGPSATARQQPRRAAARCKDMSRPGGGTKAAQLISLAAQRHELATIPLEKVSGLATELAGQIGYHPGTARRVLLRHVRQLQRGRQ